MREMNKLVRDKIPDIIISNGEKPYYHILDQKDYIKSLSIKMMEEYNEILSASSNIEVLEECADLLEVLFAYVKAHDFDTEDLIKACKEKRDKRGGFDKRIFLEGTE